MYLANVYLLATINPLSLCLFQCVGSVMLLCKDFQVSSLIAFSQFSLLLQKQSLFVASLRSWPSEFQLHCSAVSYVLHETGNGDWPHFPQRFRHVPKLTKRLAATEIQLCRLFCRMHTYRLATDEQCTACSRNQLTGMAVTVVPKPTRPD